MNLAKELRKARLEGDITYAVIAQETGLAIDTVRRAENGEGLHMRTHFKLEKWVRSHRSISATA